MNKKERNRPSRSAEMNEELEKYWDLLDLFSWVPDFVQDRTLLEISGYPHFENVCSNILAFYFDPGNEHGMKDLLLQSFLDCVEAEDKKGECLHEEVWAKRNGLNQQVAFESAVVRREESTEANKRLDLLIELDGFVIGIENKIFHHVNNPFDEYDALIKSRAAKDGKEQVNVVLSLLPVSSAELGAMKEHQFVNVMYQSWIPQIIKMMGPYMLDAEPKHQHYFFDFMKTMQRLAGDNMSNPEAKKFFVKNYAQVVDLINQFEQFENALIEDIKNGLGDDVRCSRYNLNEGRGLGFSSNSWGSSESLELLVVIKTEGGFVLIVDAAEPEKLRGALGGKEWVPKGSFFRLELLESDDLNKILDKLTEIRIHLDKASSEGE